MAGRQAEHAGEAAGYDDRCAVGICRRIVDGDRFDQAADDWREFAGLFALGDRLTEQRDPSTVGIDDAGMQDERRQGTVFAQLGLRNGELLAAVVQRGLDLFEIDTGGDGVDQATDLRLQRLDALFGGAEALGHLGAFDGTRFVVALHNDGDDVGREQFFLQTAQHACFERASADAARIAARPDLPVTNAAPSIAIDDRVFPAAFPAHHQPGEKVPRTRLAIEGGAIERGATILHGLPAGIVDDPKLGCFAFDQIAAGVRPRYPQAGDRISQHADPVVGDAADIGRVVQYPVLATARSVDRARPPLAPPW